MFTKFGVFWVENGLKRANLGGLVTYRESNTCKVVFEKGVSKGPKGRQLDFKRASFASQLGVNCKPKEHVLDLLCAKKCDKTKKKEKGKEKEKEKEKWPLPLTPPPRGGEQIAGYPSAFDL